MDQEPSAPKEPTQPTSTEPPETSEAPETFVTPESAASHEPSEPSPTHEPVEPIAAAISDTKKRPWHAAFTSSVHKRRNWILVLIVLLLVAAGAGGGWYFGHHQSVKPVKTATKHSSAARVIKPVAIAQTQFLTAPVQLGDLHFFKDYSVFGQDCSNNPTQTNCPNEVSDSDVAYYKIGTTATGQPIIDVYDTESDVDAFSFVAIGTTTGNYAVLGLLDDSLYRAISATNPSDQQYATDFKNALSPNVTLDTKDSISQLSFPNSVTVAGFKLSATYQAGPNGYFLVGGLNSIRGSYYGSETPPAIAKLATAGDKTFYQVTSDNEPNYAIKEIYGTVNNVYAASYGVQDPLVVGDGKKLAATWTSGENVSANYDSRSNGCGSANGYVIAKNISQSTLSVVGTGPDGEKLYGLPSDSALFKEIYADDYNNGTGLDDASLQNLTADQFQAKHGVFLSPDSLGELVVYLRSDMIQGGGCGKPVVYLYPQKTTTVSVKVGATITKSVPTYPSGGWQHIIAKPGSKLTYDGKNYDSLFWEGLGNGTYPAITSGMVVPKDQLVATIREQLTEQGLNASETKDFLAYWQPKLPTSPYTRLTWFNKAQMNALAPLSISPKPTTTIRVFLDFQGLQQPTHLPAQHLSSVARKGFTVVEWGGLLKGE